jgi:ribokinase
VILNPAPATGPLPADWYAHIDYLIPNESEAEALTGVAVTDQDSAGRRAVDKAGGRQGDRHPGCPGALFVDGRATGISPAPGQRGGHHGGRRHLCRWLCRRLARGLRESEAIVFGQRAAALSVTRAGAQPSIPYLAELAP